MSFLGTLGKIFNVVQIAATVAAPVLNLVPGSNHNDTLSTIATRLMVAELRISGQNTGTQKKQLATAVVNAVHPGLDQAALGSSIDVLVGLLNQLTAAAAKVPVSPQGAV